MVLSVELRRQISVEFEGRSGWKNWVIGSGILRPSTSPFYCHTQGSCSTHDNEEMDWEGEVRCKADVRIGRFDSGCIALKDFILFSITSPSTSVPFHAIGNAVAISLVTDSWLSSEYHL
ncbi:hypothetical protein WG66_012064 [Moniliophthora roreri]|nr:hypothetical protein WG66_012064 [Moniliophthora roreri]